MSKQHTAPWFADSGGVFTGQEPFFYKTENFPWAKYIERNWHLIKDELMENLERGANLDPYMDKSLASRPERWRTLGLMFWMRRSQTECARFPKTWALLSKVPNLTAVSFNLLEAGSNIKPHFGNTNAIIRCHLGLKIPAPAPRCGFRVGDQTRSWKEGELLMFCDAHMHTAWNNSDSDRYVMVLDVMKDEFATQGANISSRVLGSVKAEVLIQNKPWIALLARSAAAKGLLSWMLSSWYRLDIALFGWKGADRIATVGEEG